MRNQVQYFGTLMFLSRKSKKVLKLGKSKMVDPTDSENEIFYPNTFDDIVTTNDRNVAVFGAPLDGILEEIPPIRNTNPTAISNEEDFNTSASYDSEAVENNLSGANYDYETNTSTSTTFDSEAIENVNILNSFIDEGKTTSNDVEMVGATFVDQQILEEVDHADDSISSEKVKQQGSINASFFCVLKLLYRAGGGCLLLVLVTS